jgi:hypothetical protein
MVKYSKPTQIVVAALKMKGPQHSHLTDKPPDHWQISGRHKNMLAIRITVTFKLLRRLPLSKASLRSCRTPSQSVRVRIATQHQENMARYSFVLLLTVVAAVLADDVIVLKQGRLRGHRLTTRKGREIFAFQGIPYAKPPVGKLRFQVRSTGVS